MNNQEIINIKIEDLVLWTENPRDPISPDLADQDVADKAFEDLDGRWNLKKLISDMGEYYEDIVMAYCQYFPVTTARFANVAFSNGSLPVGWLHRVQRLQPLAAPSDVRRYFVSPDEVCGSARAA